MGRGDVEFVDPVICARLPVVSHTRLYLEIMLRIVPISLQRIFNDNKREGPTIE